MVHFGSFFYYSIVPLSKCPFITGFTCNMDHFYGPKI